MATRRRKKKIKPRKDGRAREILNRGPKKNVEILNYPHLKNTEIHAEGQLEPKAVSLIAIYPQAASVQEQPEHLVAHDSEGKLEAFPDFRIGLTTGEAVFIEVKPFDEFNKPEIRKQLGRVKRAVETQHKSRYVVLTEYAIELQPRLDNVYLLLNYRYIQIPPDILSRIRSALTGSTGMPFGDVLTTLCDGRLDICYSLIARGYLRVDLMLSPARTWTIYPSFEPAQQIHLFDLIGWPHQPGHRLLDPYSARHDD